MIGGRGASVGTPTDRIVAVDPVKRTVRVVGSLGRSRSPISPPSATRAASCSPAATSATGTVSSLTELVPSTHAARASRRRWSRTSTRPTASATSARRCGTRCPYVYVPNSDSGTVDVIDQRTFKVVEHFAVGALPQHVVPAWDLKTLYVTNDLGNTLTPINPNTGKPGHTIPVDDPYNMYFTPDGRYAIVVAERLHRLDFRDAHTFKLHHSLHGPVLGRRPHGLLRRRQLRDRELRVLEPAAEGRHRGASGSTACSRCVRARRRRT